MSDIFAQMTSSPGRILGVVLFFAAGIIWYIGEQKKKKEREAKRAAKQQNIDSKKVH